VQETTALEGCFDGLLSGLFPVAGTPSHTGPKYLVRAYGNVGDLKDNMQFASSLHSSGSAIDKPSADYTFKCARLGIVFDIDKTSMTFGYPADAVTGSSDRKQLMSHEKILDNAVKVALRRNPTLKLIVPTKYRSAVQKSFDSWSKGSSHRISDIVEYSSSNTDLVSKVIQAHAKRIKAEGMAAGKLHHNEVVFDSSCSAMKQLFCFKCGSATLKLLEKYINSSENPCKNLKGKVILTD
jgi:hypothetical protein